MHRELLPQMRTVVRASLLAAILVFGMSGTVQAADTVNLLMKTSQGDIAIELDREKAPDSVANFLKYVEEGFYNGTIFHRVIAGFMIQGGGFDKAYAKKDTHAPIQNEADNGLKNDRGTLAMARTSDPHSATAQFFINHKNNDFLNHSGKSMQGWGYAVFGRVTSGMEVVDSIASIPTGRGGPFPTDVPQTPVIIESVTVVE